MIDAMGPSCRRLITSRLSQLATATRAHAIELGVLSPQAAIQHLADWAGVEPDAMPAERTKLRKSAGTCRSLSLDGAIRQAGVVLPHLLDALRNAELGYAERVFKGYACPPPKHPLF